MSAPNLNPGTLASEAVASYAIEKPTRAVKLFRNGANQAVRIPKEFELPGVDAVMYREGGKLIIETPRPPFEKGSAAALLALLNTMEPIGEEFPDITDADLLPLDDIDFGTDTP